MGSTPDKPETPESEVIQKENAIQNLAKANQLTDDNFAAMESAITRDTSTARAGAGNAENAMAAARQASYSGKPMAQVASDTARSIGADSAQLTDDSGEGLRQLAKQGEGIRQQTSRQGQQLSSLEHQRSMLDASQDHSNAMALIDIGGAVAGGAYYATDGFTNNPFGTASTPQGPQTVTQAPQGMTGPLTNRLYG